MLLQDLEVGDLIVSKKEHSKWNLLQRFFAHSIAKVARKHYGKNVMFPDATHIRIIVTKSESGVLSAHATAPFATLEEAKDYFVDPSYALVCRNKLYHPESDTLLHVFIRKYLGSIYDVADLLRISTGWKWLDWGRNHKVCSTLTASMENEVFNIVPKNVGMDWVTPCYPVNDLERYEIVNLDRNKLSKHKIKVEPKELKCEK